MNKPQYIIVHHSASPRDTTTVAMIDGWHKTRGFPVSEIGYYVGYHRVILPNGNLFVTRKDSEVGAHTKTADGMNFKSIGICLTGNFENEEPTQAQKDRLASEVSAICAQHGIPRENILSHGEVVNTLCAGKNLIPFVKELRSPKTKERYVSKSDNAFVCLVVMDDLVDQAAAKSFVYEAQKVIYQASRSKLVLDINLVFRKMPIYDSQRTKEIARTEFELSDYQAVVAVYAPGKFREVYGNMNPTDKEFGILINQSFERTTEGHSPAIVLAHELCHAFLFYLNERAGTKFDYANEVHKTPNEFADDFDLMLPYIEFLYKKVTPATPEPMPAPSEPAPVPSEPEKPMPETPAPVKPGIKTTEFWLTLFGALSGLGVMFGYLTPEEAAESTKKFEMLIGAVFTLAVTVGYFWSRVRVKISK